MSKTKQIKELKKAMKSFNKAVTKSLDKFDKLDLQDSTKGFYVKDAHYHVKKGEYDKDTIDDNFIERVYYGGCSYDFNRQDEGEVNHVYREFYFSISLQINKKEKISVNGRKKN